MAHDFDSAFNELLTINNELELLKNKLAQVAKLYEGILKPWPGFETTAESKTENAASAEEKKEAVLDEELLKVEKALSKARLVHKKTATKNNGKLGAQKSIDVRPKQDNKNDATKAKTVSSGEGKSNNEQNVFNLEETILKLKPIPEMAKLRNTHRKLREQYMEMGPPKMPKEATQFLATVQGDEPPICYEHVFRSSVSRCLIICESCIMALRNKDKITKNTKANFAFFEHKLLLAVKEIYNYLLDEISVLLSCEVVTPSMFKFENDFSNPLHDSIHFDVDLLTKAGATEVMTYGDKNELLKWNSMKHKTQSLKTDLKIKNTIHEAFMNEYAKAPESSRGSPENVQLFQNIFALLCSDNNLPAAVPLQS